MTMLTSTSRQTQKKSTVTHRETERYFACCLASEASLCAVSGVDNVNSNRQIDTEKEYRVTHRETERYFECISPLRLLCVQQVLLTMLTLTGRQAEYFECYL